MNNKYDAKKRMMFIAKEDYNFFAYNILLILDQLGCDRDSKKFKDFRKIAFLIDFIMSNKNIEQYTTDELSRIYINSQFNRIQLISHVLIALSLNNYIGLEPNIKARTVDIWVNKSVIDEIFWSSYDWMKERSNIDAISRSISRLSSITVNTFIDKVFKSKNVRTWQI